MANGIGSALEVRDVGKRYFLGGAIRERKLVDLLASAAGALISPETASIGSRARQFWALRNVSFRVDVGEAVGIVGNNGAGKSTLLKLLSRITEPTSGEISYFGKIGSLLEVGTGFHPELTGRDNIYLNGAILGMTRRDIARQFDSIVDFAGIERFVDVPVKRYSSGMYLRLAFAVAAHLDTDILLIDEVLAVGDVSFQQKCLARMDDVVRAGRTIVFVSHNLTAVKSLCKRALVLDKGTLIADGEASQVLIDYVRNNTQYDGSRTARTWSYDEAPSNEWIRIIDASVGPANQSPTEPIYTTSNFSIRASFALLVPVSSFSMAVMLYSRDGLLIFDTGSPLTVLASAAYETICYIPGDLLNDGEYYANIIFRRGADILLELTRVLDFEVHDSEVDRVNWFGKWEGVIRPRLQWRTRHIGEPENPTVS